MPQFQQIDTYVGQIFWLIVFFGALFLLLNFVFSPRLSDLLDRRAQRIATLISQAAVHHTETTALNNQTLQAIESAQKEAHKKLAEVREEIRAEELLNQAALDKKIAQRLEASDKDLQKLQTGQDKRLEALAHEVAETIVARIISSDEEPKSKKN